MNISKDADRHESPQTLTNVSKKIRQEVAYKVEPDGTVLDAATGETCGMIELLGCPWDVQQMHN